MLIRGLLFNLYLLMNRLLDFFSNDEMFFLLNRFMGNFFDFYLFINYNQFLYENLVMIDFLFYCLVMMHMDWLFIMMDVGFVMNLLYRNFHFFDFMDGSS